MKKILIVGAGGFGREVVWLIDRINKMAPTYEIQGFIDDEIAVGTKINQHEVRGTIKDAIDKYSDLSFCIAIGNPTVRKDIVERLCIGKIKDFPNLVDPSVDVDISSLGVGNIICANNIMTIDYKIGDFIILNLACTIGHDSKISDFVTVYPGVNISGNVTINSSTEIGTGSKIIQGIDIGSNVVLGAGSVATKNICNNVLAAGVPAVVKRERNV